MGWIVSARKLQFGCMEMQDKPNNGRFVAKTWVFCCI